MIGYGQDTWCADSLQTGRYARGATAVAQALYRRLITPRGVLQGIGRVPLPYGLDISGLLGSAATRQTLAAIPTKIRAELIKDDRVSDVLVTASNFVQSGSGGWEGTIEIAVRLADGSGSFTFTLAVSDVETALAGVRL